MAKKIYITYCSAEKNPAEKELKAIDRYKSDRIKHVYDLAKKEKADFAILSGKFGLLQPTDMIPFYDHLLKPFETTRFSKKLAKQLKNYKGKPLVFHTHWMDKDPHVAPYIESIHEACEMTKTSLELVVFEDNVAIG